jgi:hypothetical protein
VREAAHWCAGERGAAIDEPVDRAGADITKFVTEALTLGAKALTITAQTSETRALERMIKDVGEKAAAASQKAADATQLATKSATEAVAKAAADAKMAITDADEAARKNLIDAVAATKLGLSAEMQRIFDGENPELMRRLQSVLDKFGSALEKQVHTSTSELLLKATKQLDPSDPTSPMAKQAVALAEQQERFSKQIEKGQTDIATKVDELATALKVQQAKASLAKVTPIKGGTFEGQLHVLMTGIASGLGDEYEDTTTKTGLLPRSKKGDGVFKVSGQDARVVIEMTDSSRSAWGEYFDEAERNRGAAASLGIVRAADQNGGQAIRVLGQRRVVIAFDPDEDDAEILRTVILLLRTVAIAATVRTGTTEIDTAEEKIGSAIEQLGKIDSIKKAADSIQKGAAKIESECTMITTSIRRLLDQALVALGAAELESPGVAPIADVARVQLRWGGRASSRPIALSLDSGVPHDREEGHFDAARADRLLDNIPSPSTGHTSGYRAERQGGSAGLKLRVQRAVVAIRAHILPTLAEDSLRS